MRFVVICLAVLLLFSTAHAQTQILSGTITDGTTNKPVPFASIAVKNSLARTLADDAGRYSLALPPASGTFTLVVSAVGYKTVQRVVVAPALSDTAATLNIVLLPYKYALQEVSVFARPSGGTPRIEQTGALSLNNETVQKTSGMFKEAFRVVQTMPGVTSNNELSARFNVRGGNQDENLVLVNGTQVFEPYHAKYAGQGSISVLNIDLVEKVDIVTGGFSAEYGDRMSSVVNFTYREGARDGIHGSAGVSLTNVDALLEGPIADGGSFVVGFRQSFVQLLLGLLNLGVDIKPSFYDLQGQAKYRFSPYYAMTLQFVQSGDQFQVDQSPEQQNFGGNNFFINGSRVQWTQENINRAFIVCEQCI
jgi:outer membrane receptor protein involved in Fe transport